MTKSHRHISVPVFGPSTQGAPPAEYIPPHSGAKPPSTPAPKPAPPRSTTEPLNRADVAGEAAAKRMDELQGSSNTFNKPYLYQKYGQTPPQPNLSVCPSATPSAPPPPPSNSRPTTETADQKRARLHKLFNTWIPRANEFYKSYGTLDLTAEELKAVQDEIVSNRVNSALAAGQRTTYRADWETALVYLPPQRRVASEAMDVDGEDLLGLGLASSSVVKCKGGGYSRSVGLGRATRHSAVSCGTRRSGGHDSFCKEHMNTLAR